MAVRLPVVIGQLDAKMAGDRVEMYGRVGRPADGRVQDNGVFEGGPCHDVGRLQVGPDHVDDAVARVIGHLAAFAVGGRDRRRTGKLHAETFGKRVHRGGRSHGVAIAGGRRRRCHEVEESVIVNFTGGNHLPCFPDDGARPGALSLVPAIQHWSHRQGDSGNVDGRCRHQERRCCLVAADHQHDTVDGIAVKGFDKAEIGKVPVEHGGRPLACFLDRMDRHFDGKAARGDDAVAHPLCQFEMVPVAGGKVRARLGDGDDRAAVAKLFAGKTIIEITLGIERCHFGIIRIVEPLPRAQLCRFDFLVTHLVPLCRLVRLSC